MVSTSLDGYSFNHTSTRPAKSCRARARSQSCPWRYDGSAGASHQYGLRRNEAALGRGQIAGYDLMALHLDLLERLPTLR